MLRTLQENLALVVVIGTGILLSVLTFFVIVDWLNARTKTRFSRRVSEKHNLMEKASEASQVKLSLLRSFFSKNGSVTREDFRNVADPMFDGEEDMVVSYHWIAKQEVSNDQRPAPSAETMPDHTFSTDTGKSIFPVMYKHGQTFPLLEQGTNVLEKEQIRQSLKEAVSSGNIQVTPPFQVNVNNQNKWIYILLYPVFDRTSGGDKELKGLVSGVYDMSKMLELVFSRKPSLIYSQFAVLVNQNQESSFLHVPPLEEQNRSMQNMGWRAYFFGNYTEHRPLRVARSACLVTYSPGPTLLRTIDFWMAPAGSGIVLLLTGFLVVYLRIMKNRKQVIERTVEEKTRQLEKANQAKRDFLARMSHEIRTPLNAVMGMIDLLESTPLNKEQKEYVNVSKQSSQILLDLINDVLDLSKAEAGQLELHREPFELEAFVSDTVSYFAREAANKGIDIHMLVDGECPAVINEDRKQLREVMINLIGNAIKYTEMGEVNVFVSVERGGDETRLYFEVEDTGTGIPEEKQKTLFNQFSRANTPSTNNVEGTGLGLSISKELVELMGGQIDVDSEEGEGSTFYFHIPLQKNNVHSEADSESEIVADQYRVDLSDHDILVIDDSATNRLVLKSILSDWKGSITEAKNIKEGLEQVQTELNRQNSFDLIILDGDTSKGSETEQMQEFNRSGSEDIVLMLDVDHQTSDVEWFDEVPISKRLIKPVDRAKLQKILMNGSDQEAVRQTEEPPNELSDIKDLDTEPELLIAEDNEHNRKLMNSILKLQPVQMDFAVDGEEALTKAKKGQYDLIFMDIRMPEMNGLEVTEEYRKWEQEENVEDRTPIVALSAHALEEQRQESIEAGCDTHLSKPVLEEELIDAIKQFMVTPQAPDVLTSSDHDESATEPRIDEKNVIEIDERYREFVPELLKDIRDQLKTIKEKSNQCQFEAIEDIAHDIKGAAASYGFQNVQKMAEDIEVHAREEAEEKINQTSNRMQEYLNKSSVKFVQPQE